MKSDDNMQIDEKAVCRIAEQIRQSYSQMLKMYLHLYKKYDQLKSNYRDEKPKNYFYTANQYLYDEKGKINWDIIRQFIPQDMEKSIREEFRELNNNEIRLCCLLFFNLPYKNIAEILPYTQKSIRSILFRIKRKTGIKDINKMINKIIVNTT